MAGAREAQVGDGARAAPQPPADPSAETIANRYRVLGPIGRGGMGEVLKVEDLFRARALVALKRFHLDAAPEAVDLFRREFLTLAKLRHPSVAQVFDFGTIPGSGDAYFTSELVSGIDLFEASAGLGWDDVYDLVVQLCRGLAYVHSRGLIHRDVKPSNVLVTSERGARLVKLIDFGLATAAAAAGPGAEREPAIRGTVHYIAPELAQGAPVDRRADLYSLGVTLFQIATRDLPFQGKTSREVLAGQISGRPPRPRELRPDLPEGLERIILRLLEKDPARRHASAEQVITELGTLAGRVFPVETKETEESYVLSGGFVGRDAELRQLEKAFEGVFGKSGVGGDPGTGTGTGPTEAAGDDDVRSFVVVTGEVGVGKGRLLREFKHHAQLSRVDVIEAACDPSGRAYAAVVEVASRLLQLVRPQEDALLGPSGPLIRRFLGEETAGDAAAARSTQTPRTSGRIAADPARDRLRLFDAVVTFFLAATWMRPAVVVFHDLERADAETLALIAHLARAVGLAAKGAPSARPLLLIAASLRTGAAEPDEARSGASRALAALEDEELARRIDLAPIGEPEVTRLAATMLGITDERRPDLVELARFLFRETSGNPFLIEELMKSLLERGAIRSEPRGWKIAPPGEAVRAAAGAERPAGLLRGSAGGSIRDVFAERLSRLPAELARPLEALAVARRPAARSLLEAVLGPGEAACLPAQLDALAARGMVAREAEAGGPETFRFAHELFRQTVYDTIPADERRRLHAAFGAALEAAAATGPRTAGEATAPLAALVEHFAEAGDAPRTFRYALRSGDEARLLFANERAIALYERALEVAAAHPEACPREDLIELYESLGRVRERTGDHAGAADEYWRILELGAAALKTLGSAGIARIQRRIGETLEARGEHDLAIESYGAGLRLLGEGDRINSVEGAKLLGATASTYVKLGHYDMAISFCNAGLGWVGAQATGAGAGARGAAEEATLLNTIGVALSCTGRYEDAAAQFERALAARERVGEPEAIAQTLNNLGAVFVETGQVGRAIAFFEQALERSERTGDARGIAETAVYLGSAYSSLGQDERAARHFARGLEIQERLGDPEGMLAALNRLGSLETDTGEYGDAFGRLERARRLVRRLGETRGAAVTAIFGAKLLARLGDFEAARPSVEEAIRLARKLGLRREEAEATFLLGRLERAVGRLDEAERALNQALTDYQKLGNDLESAAVTIAVLEVLVERGDLDLASLLAAKLDATARDVRAGRLLGRLDLAIGHLETALAQESARAGASGAAARLGDAVLRLDRAREQAREGRRPELEWRADHAIARAFEVAGASERALAAAVRGMEVVRDLYTRVPAAYRDRYLAHPARQALRADFQRLRG